MNTKNYASMLLEELSSGLDDIESKYTLLKKQTAENYKLASENLSKEFDKKRNNANTLNKINEMNAQNELLRKGLSRSGESMQTALFSSAALTGDIAHLDSEEASSKAALEREQQNDINQLDINASEESRKFRSDIMSSYLDQFNAEAEYALALRKQAQSELNDAHEWELDKAKAESESKQQQFENELELEYLKIAQNKAKAQQPTESYTPVLSDDGEIKTPSDSAVDPLSPQGLFNIILKNYKDDPERLKSELRDVINDKTVSADFRYEFYNIAAEYLK